MDPILLIAGLAALGLWLSRRQAPGGGAGGAGTPTGPVTGADGSVSLPAAIALQAADGRFVVAERAGEGYLAANRAEAGAWERLQPVPQGGIVFAFRTVSGRYVDAELGGGRGLQASAAAIVSTALFRIHVLSDGRIAIEAAKGQFWQQVGDGGLEATAAGINPASSFKVFSHPDPASSSEGASPATAAPCVAFQVKTNDLYVVAENWPGFPMIVDRANVGLWERFRWINNANGTVSLLAWNGKYLQVGAGNDLFATGDRIEDATSFAPELVGGGYVALRSAASGLLWSRRDNERLSAAARSVTTDDEQFRIVPASCDGTPTAPGGAGGIEPGEPDPGEPGEGEGGELPPAGGGGDWTRADVIEAHGQAIGVGQPALWIGATFFPLAWAYLHDRARGEENLRWLADRGVQYVRALGCVGPGQSWEDRTVRPDTPYGEVTDWAASFGPRVQWTAFGNLDMVPEASHRRQVIDRLIAMTAGRDGAVFVFEVANEPAGTGWDSDSMITELRELARVLREETPQLVALGAAPGDAEAARWNSGSAADLLVMHLDRSVSGTCGYWRPPRQPWEVQFLADVPRVWLNNEPIGPESSVASDDDPARLAMHAATTWLAGGAAYTLHAGPGIRFGGAADLARGRSANFWEVAHLETTLAGLRQLRDRLPADLPNWTKHNTHWPGWPWVSDPVVVIQKRDGLCRIYAASAGGRFVCLPTAIAEPVPLTAKDPMRFDVSDPISGDTIDDVTLDRGETYTLAPRPAVVIEGNWA